MFTVPDFLQQGDRVAIVSPSGPIDIEYIHKAVSVLESWGLQVCLGKHVCHKYGVFAGTDAQRLADFQEVIDNDSIKAVFCSRGGYGAIRIVQNLDFTKYVQKPKWIIGFSDITVFHAKISSLHIASMHAAMPKNFSTVTPQSLESLQQALFGNVQPIRWQSSSFNTLGTARGRLTGGNLSMLYSLRGLSFEYDYSGTLLFIEDLNEYLYHIDRMMQNLKLSGILSRIAGLIVGGMSGMKQGVDVYNASVEAIISEVLVPYNIPVCFNAPTGHESDNMALIPGIEYQLQVQSNNVVLQPLTVL
ncbi:MAG TPA: LD-carboxypeptidase [Bacteroidales bacterium]|nr:LD-carboxypeptidase [Bacteroidales bacterium]